MKMLDIKDKLFALMFATVGTAFICGLLADKNGIKYFILFIVYGVIFIFELILMFKLFKKLKIEEV